MAPGLPPIELILTSPILRKTPPAPPTFTIEPKDGNLVSGQTASLDCAASGQPRPVISWLRARGKYLWPQLSVLLVVEPFRADKVD